MQYNTQSYTSTIWLGTKYIHTSLLYMYIYTSSSPPTYTHVHLHSHHLKHTVKSEHVHAYTSLCDSMFEITSEKKTVKQWSDSILNLWDSSPPFFCCCTNSISTTQTIVLLIKYHAHFHVETHFLLTKFLWSKYYDPFKRWTNIIVSGCSSLRFYSVILILQLLWYQLLGCLGYHLGSSLGKRLSQSTEMGWT